MEKHVRLISISIVLCMAITAFSGMITAYNEPDEERFEFEGSSILSPYRKMSGLYRALQEVSENTTDSDGDGIYDSVELILGTDPENPDSDFDGLNDSYEVKRDMNPFDPDTNGDGMPDFIEIHNRTLDHDGDGLINPMDHDNDGDGLIDEMDISPWARSIMMEEFNLNIEKRNNRMEVVFQIRTEDPKHLRLYSQYWDWPSDSKGSMKDMDASTKDVTVVPTLVVKSTRIPSSEILEEYNIMPRGDELLVPLVPIRKDEDIIAFGAKIGFEESDPVQIQMDAEMIWRVHGFTDKRTSGLFLTDGRRISINSSGEVVARTEETNDANTFIIEEQGENQVSIKTLGGMYLSTGQDGVLSANAIDVGDKEKFYLERSTSGVTTLKTYDQMNISVLQNGSLQGQVSSSPLYVDNRFIGYNPEMIVLSLYNDRFNICGLKVIEERGSEVEIFYGEKEEETLAAHLVLAYDFLRNSSNSLSDMDQLISDRNITVQGDQRSFSDRYSATRVLLEEMIPSALGSLPGGLQVPITIAVDDLFKQVDLENASGINGVAGSSISIAYAQSPELRSRSLKMTWYNTDDESILEVEEVIERVDRMGISGEINPEYTSVFLVWNYGECVTFGIPDFETPMSEDRIPRDLLDASIKDILDFAIGALELPGEIHLMRFDYKFSKFWKPRVQFLKSRSVGSGAKFKMTSKLKMQQKNIMKTKAVKGFDRFGNTMAQIAVIAESIAVGFKLHSILSCTDMHPMMLYRALMMTLMEYIYNMVIVLIGLIPFVGWIISLLISISDFFGDWSNKLFTAIINAMSSVTATVNPMISMVGDPTMKVIDKDKSGPGIDVGDRIEYSATMRGLVTGSDWDIVKRSDIYPFFVIHNGDPKAAHGQLFNAKQPLTENNKGHGWYCCPYNQSSWKRLENSPSDSNLDLPLHYGQEYETGVWLEPGTPMPNYPMTLQLFSHYDIHYKYEVFYFFVFYWFWKEYRSSTHGLQASGDPFTIHFDVMPENIDGFINWRSIKPLDSDFDGIPNINETTTDPNKRDTDGDGLGDKHEIELGYDPADPDPDGDGLVDSRELELGTNFSDPDSDGDGLSDYVEVKGWVINFTYCGETFYWQATSDPNVNDTDGDGLLDELEFLCLLNPRSNDTDGDGIGDELMDYFTTEMEFEGSFQYSDFGEYGDDIAVDKQGNIYLVTGNGSIIKMDGNGTFIREWKEGYEFIGPHTICVDDEGYVIVGTGNHLNNDFLVYIFNPNGTLNCSWGGEFQYEVFELDVDDQGNIFALVMARDWYELAKFSRNGTVLWGTGFDYSTINRPPQGLAVDSKGNVYLSDTINHRIHIIGPDGNLSYTWKDQGTGIGQFISPDGIFIDDDDNIYICDRGNHRIQKFDRNRRPVAWFGTEGTDDGQYQNLCSIWVTDDHRIFTCDQDSSKILNRIQILKQNITFHQAEDDTEFIDTDEDGLTDIFEEAGWNITVEFSDGKKECPVWGNPLLPDSDFDGLSDLEEFNISSDPGSPDTDMDTLLDLFEIEIGTNASSFDSDGDGLDDGLEYNIGSDPLKIDTDGDGADDQLEYNEGTSLISNDTDGDGLDDLEEILLGSDPKSPDSDGDLLFDRNEYDLGTGIVENDTDKDGLIDGHEVFFKTDPSKNDTDGDGLWDMTELRLYLNPLNNDTDMDGIPDLTELELGTDPRWNDTDGDGVLDGDDPDTYSEIQGKILVVSEGMGSELIDELDQNVEVEVIDNEEFISGRTDEKNVLLLGESENTDGDLELLISGLFSGTNRSWNDGEEMPRFGSRHGLWAETQTVMYLMDPAGVDAVRVLETFKGKDVTLMVDGVNIRYYSPKEFISIRSMEAYRAVDSSLSVELEELMPVEVEIRALGEVDPPLDEENGLKWDEVFMGRYLEVTVDDTSDEPMADPVAGALIEVYYTEEDLWIDDMEINESQLSLYWFDENLSEWVRLTPDLDWVLNVGINTTDVIKYGREYAGKVWASVSHLSLFGLAGKPVEIPQVPCIAEIRDDMTIIVGETVIFDGSLCSGNGGIANFTWKIDNSEFFYYLYGMSPSFIFKEPGEYWINLTVIDMLGLTATDSIIVSVAPPPIIKFILMVGPVKNEEGVALQGAVVRILGTSNITDAEGFTTFLLTASYFNTSVEITIEMEGYQDLVHTAMIDEEGNLVGTLPALKEVVEPSGDKDEGPPWVAILIVIIVLLMALGTVLYVVRKKSEGEEGESWIEE